MSTIRERIRQDFPGTYTVIFRYLKRAHLTAKEEKEFFTVLGQLSKPQAFALLNKLNHYKSGF